MDNYVYPAMITAINVIILISLSISFNKHRKGRSNDTNFHSRMLFLCSMLIVANTFAFGTAIYGYFILKSFQPEILNIGRFADRYCMLFAYIALDKMDER